MDDRDETPYEMPTVAQIVARNVRRLRESRTKSHLDVADAACELGLPWTTAMVSRIETGRREVTLEEFLALPLVLTLTLDQSVTLVDLLSVEADEPYVLSFRRPTRLADVQALLAEPGVLALRISAIPDRVRETLDRGKRQAQLARALNALNDGSLATESLATESLATESLAAESDAIAAKLGLTQPELAKACEALWDQPTIQAECEHRLLTSGVDLSHPSKTRLLADHIVRELTTELNDHLHTG